MDYSILTELLQHGLLGVAVVGLVLVVRALYKRNQELVKEKEALHQQYQDKLNAYSERYVSKSEEWAEKNRELAVNTNAVLDALTRSRGGLGGG